MSAIPNILALTSLREQRGFTVAEVASHTAISPARLSDFEAGTRVPSRKQMEKLAEAYGVPLYSLFGSEIPSVNPLPEDFRKREPTKADLSPRGVRTLLTSERISAFSKQLAKELNYVPARLDGPARQANSNLRRASELRRVFDKWLSSRQQDFGFTGAMEQRFLSAFRLFFEIQGGVLNVNVAPPDDYMGFFVEPDGGLPTIFVNRVISSKKAQLFTLAHEYAHSLLGQDGVSNPFNAKNAVERGCNVFAAEFLAPMKEFKKVVDSSNLAEESSSTVLVEYISKKTLLSKQATAIRLVEAGYINQAQLSTWRKRFNLNPGSEKEDEKELAGESGGGVPHAKMISEIGHLPIYLASKALHAGIVDSYDIEDGLGLSRSLQERAFKLVNRRFEVALG